MSNRIAPGVKPKLSSPLAKSASPRIAIAIAVLRLNAGLMPPFLFCSRMFKQRLSFRIGNVVVKLARLAKVTSRACAKAITPLAFVGCICPLTGGAAPLQISAFDCSGKLTWSNAPVPGICTIESAVTPGSPWSSGPNLFSTNSAGATQIPVEGAKSFFRVRGVDVSPTPEGFTNLVCAYGLLETIAGTGEGRTDGVSYWQSWFEGGSGVNASLSRPHFAMADRAGNVYIADKNSHSILKLTPAGSIHTYAGNHSAGWNGEGPASATQLQLNFPNSLWLRADGTLYVLDTNNGRVRRVDTNGIMATLFLATADGSALSGGRTLWVKDDESLAYFGAETRVRSWSPANGLRTVGSGFTELGTLCVESGGDLVVCDRGAHYVYRMKPDGTRTVIAGNGSTTGGGDGFAAVETGLNGVRGTWPVPTGGYLVLTHDGCQLWYVDAAGIIHLLLNGAGGRTHSGDGLYFYSPAEWRISEGRSITMDYAGNILVCESDYGYVRRIRFQRME